MDSEPRGEVGTPTQLGDKIRFRACALPSYHIAVVWKRDKMEFEQEIVQKNCFESQFQEFYPYCIEDTDKSTPEKIVLSITLENEEAENFKTIILFQTPIGLFTAVLQIHNDLYFLKLGFTIIQNDTNKMRKEMLTVKPN
ncbi:hypothetical protein TNIN_291382 [Trichonephila inaurata madagascariensis]|uniref:Uncharacterized protein n=1 Tax=Trichonephila inaurata madagascariensis TaxID=2747483 RepID=A0A8X6WQE2_9ARAC|nr:hypothetical protein TNIN_291382 [Trichonephila inaurata madagascariensis]